MLESKVINKERLSGAYRLSAYFLAKMTSEFPVVVAYPAMVLLCVYFLTGFTIAATNFVFLLGTLFLLAFAGLVRQAAKKCTASCSLSSVAICDTNCCGSLKGIGVNVGILFFHDAKILGNISFQLFNFNMIASE